MLKHATRWRAAYQIRDEIPSREAGHPADHMVDHTWETVDTVRPLTHWGGRTPHGAMPMVALAPTAPRVTEPVLMAAQRTHGCSLEISTSSSTGVRLGVLW